MCGKGFCRWLRDVSHLPELDNEETSNRNKNLRKVEIK